MNFERLWPNGAYLSSHCRYRILHPLQLGPLFPNDAEILRLKVGLVPNQMLN